MSLLNHGPSSAGEPDMAPAREERRRTRRLSGREAAGSALATATSDNFLNAFAVHLQASSVQLGTLAAIPQLAGALFQFAALWLDRLLPRRRLIVANTLLQALAVALLSLLAMDVLPGSVTLLVLLVMLNHIAMNLAQPHWRAWLGNLVPPRARGRFFATRSRITMLLSTAVFAGGGVVLSVSAGHGMEAAGFAALFALAAGGRLMAARAVSQMHDAHQDGDAGHARPGAVSGTFLRVAEALRDRQFRLYIFFVAGIQGAVAFTAPFFTVYMLSDLGYSYFEFAITSLASIATQFLMLRYWGLFGDRYGSLAIMRVTAWLIALVPPLWLVSDNFYYLLGAQVVAGIGWSGFSLGAGNYLYDLRPHRTHLATYAAIQAGIAASLVCLGALAGGYASQHADEAMRLLPSPLDAAPPLLLIFAVGGGIRAAVVAWFLPRLGDVQLRKHPQIMEIIFRVAQINSISGVVLDWLSVGRKASRRKGKPPDRNQRRP